MTPTTPLPRLAGPAATLLALSLACAPAAKAPPAPTSTPPYRVQDGFIRDAQDRVVILRGFNLAARHKRAPYFGFHGAEDIARIRDDWGMNSIRFVLQWAALEPEPDVYNLEYLAQVRQRLDWAEAAGVLVVLDMHQDVYGEGFGHNGAPRWTCDEGYYDAFMPSTPWFLDYLDPNVVACFDHLWTDATLQDHFIRAWAVVARELGDHPAVIGVDVLNEPFPGSFSVDSFEPMVLQPLYEDVIRAAREHAPQWLAFLEPFNLRNLGQATRLRPFSFEGVVYAPHSYDAAAEQGEGFSPERREAILSNVRALHAEAQALGAALWVGEFGGMASHPGITEYMDAQHDALAEVWAGGAYWDYGRDDGYGWLDPDGAEKPGLIAALVRPWPERIAGTPRTWSFDESSGTLTVRWMASGTAETWIATPPRLFPEGVQVDCSGCTAEETPGRVLLRADPGVEAEAVISAR